MRRAPWGSARVHINVRVRQSCSCCCALNSDDSCSHGAGSEQPTNASGVLLAIIVSPMHRATASTEMTKGDTSEVTSWRVVIN